jgi:hypothetical protein
MATEDNKPLTDEIYDALPEHHRKLIWARRNARSGTEVRLSISDVPIRTVGQLRRLLMIVDEATNRK